MIAQGDSACHKSDTSKKEKPEEMNTKSEVYKVPLESFHLMLEKITRNESAQEYLVSSMLFRTSPVCTGQPNHNN